VTILGVSMFDLLQTADVGAPLVVALLAGVLLGACPSLISL